MSLFHSPREMRMISPRKRKKPSECGDRQEMYPCELCNDEYDSETDLHIHRKAKHKQEMSKMLLDEMVCKTCVRKQESYEHLIKHIKTQHLLSSEDSEYVEREIFICDVCHLFYFNKQMLAIHMLYSHDKKNKKTATEVCPKCGKIILIKNAWFHFQRHLTQSIAACSICLKKCRNQRELNTHVKTHACYYRCNICQYDASNKFYFTAHMEAHHLQIKSTIKEKVLKNCFYPRIITRKNDFNAGLRGLKLFDLHVCILCRAICTDASRTDHIQQCHVVHKIPENKKLYACLCGETFFNNVLLKHHVFKLGKEHRPCDTVVVDPSVKVSELCVDLPESSINVLESCVNLSESSINVLESCVNLPESSINVLESSISVLEMDVTVPDSSVNVLESGVSVLESDVSVPESSVNVLELDVNIPESSVNVLESCVNVPESCVNLPESSVNVLESCVNVPESNINVTLVVERESMPYIVIDAANEDVQ